jgi:pyrroloquinoline-quinone synthase
MSERLAAFQRHYTWVPSWGLDYFRARLTQARRDSEHALELTLTYCATADLQHEAIAALQFKCDVLWTMLDALTQAYDHAT